MTTGDAMKRYRFLWAAALMLATAASGARGDEESAIAALEKVEAEVRRDESRPGKPAVKVVLSGHKVTGAGLKELAGLESLRSLDVALTEVTDAGLRGLAGLKQLRRLDLRSTKVTDAGLKALAKLKTLRSLLLFGTSVTD